MEATRSRAVLPAGLAPRGLSRVEAAAYVGICPTTFDRLVAERAMPSAKRIGRRLVWDRLALDAAFAALPNAGHKDALAEPNGAPVFAV
jgi:predicted DNA-binding transcriptional regulator AlpA